MQKTKATERHSDRVKFETVKPSNRQGKNLFDYL
jgi:hypothetical protein